MTTNKQHQIRGTIHLETTRILHESATITNTNHHVIENQSLIKEAKLFIQSINCKMKCKQGEQKYQEMSEQSQTYQYRRWIPRIPSERELIITPNKLSSVIVYSNEQLEDLQTYCVGPKGSVIDNNKLLNIWPCFVMTTTYK